MHRQGHTDQDQVPPVGPTCDEPAEQDRQEHVNARLLEAPGKTDGGAGEAQSAAKMGAPGHAGTVGSHVTMRNISAFSMYETRSMYISQPSKITGMMANSATAGAMDLPEQPEQHRLHRCRQDHAEEPGMVDAGPDDAEPSGKQQEVERRLVQERLLWYTP